MIQKKYPKPGQIWTILEKGTEQKKGYPCLVISEHKKHVVALLVVDKETSEGKGKNIELTGVDGKPCYLCPCLPRTVHWRQYGDCIGELDPEMFLYVKRFMANELGFYAPELIGGWGDDGKPQ